MLTEDQLRHSEQALVKFRQDDALSEILDDYAELIRDYNKLKAEYEEARESRERYKKLSKGQDLGQYVIVLIDGDGDGYHFQDDFVRKGAEDGGGNAARALNEAVKAKLEAKNLGHCQILIRIYANVAGLSRTLSRAGLCGPEKRSLTPFIADFNRSFGHCDFVDAGELKESADFKLRDQLRHHISNVQCKHIFFAACHDEAYIAELTPHKSNRERFTLVNSHGHRFHQKFHKLDMNIENLPGIFRPVPLDIAAYSRAPFGPAANTKAQHLPMAALPTVSAPSPIMDSTRLGSSNGTRQKDLCHFFQVGKCWYGSDCKMAHVTNRASTETSIRDANTTGEKTPFNSNGKLQYHINNVQQPGHAHYQHEVAGNISKLPRKENIPEHHIAVNGNGFRLDTYIPRVDVAAMNLLHLHERSTKRRICNNWQLAGVCERGNDCQYDHTPLDETVKTAAELRARSLRCKKGGACRDALCTKGHICQVLDCRHYGGSTYCRLHDISHRQDFTPVGMIYDPSHLPDGNNSGDLSSNDSGTTDVVPINGSW